MVCREIRSNLSLPKDCSGASTRFLVSLKVAPPPPPPQLGLRRARAVSRCRGNRGLGSRNAWTCTRRATRRTRRLVVPEWRFRSTAGMDSDDMKTRFSGALCGRRIEGTAFASCAARRTRGTSETTTKTPAKAYRSDLWRVMAFARRLVVPARLLFAARGACGTPCDVFAGRYRAWASGGEVETRARKPANLLKTAASVTSNETRGASRTRRDPSTRTMTAVLTSPSL